MSVDVVWVVVVRALAIEVWRVGVAKIATLTRRRVGVCGAKPNA